MKLAKTLSTLSLAFALQAGALVAATVVLAPSDAAAAVIKKKSQKKAPARGKVKTNNGDGAICIGCNGNGANWSGGQPPSNQIPGRGNGGGNHVGSKRN